MKRLDKVKEITKDNYKGVVGRAADLKEKLKAYYKANKEFPSLRYIAQKWGFNMSLKALWRHRESVKAELNIHSRTKPGVVLARTRKSAEEAEVPMKVAAKAARKAGRPKKVKAAAPAKSASRKPGRPKKVVEAPAPVVEQAPVETVETQEENT